MDVSVAVPVGGGTLISGIATAIKLIRPNVRVVGVECQSGRLLHDSVAAGKPLRITRTPSIADLFVAITGGQRAQTKGAAR